MHRAHSAEVLGAPGAGGAGGRGAGPQRTQSQRHTRDRERKSPRVFCVCYIFCLYDPTRECSGHTRTSHDGQSRLEKSKIDKTPQAKTRGRTDPPRSRASSARASPSAARHASCSPRLAALPRAPSREEAGRHEGAEAGGEGHGVRGDPAGERCRGGGALVRVRVRVRVRVS